MKKSEDTKCRFSLLAKMKCRTSKIHSRLIGMMLLLVWAVISPSQMIRGEDLSFSGYANNFFVVYHNSGLDWASLLGAPAQDYYSSVNQRLRARVFYRPVNWFSAEAAYDLSLRVQDSLLYGNVFLFGVSNPLEYRYDDLNRKVYPGAGAYQGSFGIYQNLDRFLLTFRTTVFDLYVGRQTIAWGSARVINPTDIIAPFTFDELDKEERLGVDAIRLRFPLGNLGELDAGYVIGRDALWKTSAVFTRIRGYAYQSDISVLAMSFRENLLLGFDLTRAIGGAGSWLELAWVIPDQFSDQNRSTPDRNYVTTSLGFDYSFSGESYTFFEYHYNRAGELEAVNYIKNYSKPAYREGSVYLLSRHYLMPGVVYQISPLISGTFQCLINLPDPSLYLALNIEYSVAQNIYLAGGILLGRGKSPSGLQYQSEFGAYPDTYYTSFRIYL